MLSVRHPVSSRLLVVNSGEVRSFMFTFDCVLWRLVCLNPILLKGQQYMNLGRWKHLDHSRRSRRFLGFSFTGELAGKYWPVASSVLINAFPWDCLWCCIFEAITIALLSILWIFGKVVSTSIFERIKSFQFPKVSDSLHRGVSFFSHKERRV